MLREGPRVRINPDKLTAVWGRQGSACPGGFSEHCDTEALLCHIPDGTAGPANPNALDHVCRADGTAVNAVSLPVQMPLNAGWPRD